MSTENKILKPLIRGLFDHLLRRRRMKKKKTTNKSKPNKSAMENENEEKVKQIAKPIPFWKEKAKLEKRYHFGAVFNSLFCVKCAVLSGDTLAYDASILVDEHGRRRRRSCRKMARLRSQRMRNRFAAGLRPREQTRCSRADLLRDLPPTHGLLGRSRSPKAEEIRDKCCPSSPIETFLNKKEYTDPVKWHSYQLGNLALPLTSRPGELSF